MGRRFNSKSLEDRARAVRALELRTQGMKWQDIADHPDCHYSSHQNALRSVQNLLKATESETAEEYRQVISNRYELLWSKSWEQIAAADEKGQLVGKSQLVTAARGVLDSHAKLLGIANPKVEVTGKVEYTNTALDDQIEKLVGIIATGPVAAQVDSDDDDPPDPEL